MSIIIAIIVALVMDMGMGPGMAPKQGLDTVAMLAAQMGANPAVAAAAAGAPLRFGDLGDGTGPEQNAHSIAGEPKTPPTPGKKLWGKLRKSVVEEKALSKNKKWHDLINEVRQEKGQAQMKPQWVEEMSLEELKRLRGE